MKGKRLAAAILCLLFTISFFLDLYSLSPVYRVQAAGTWMTVEEAAKLAESASDGIRQTSIELVKKQIELQQAKDGILDTRKKESTIRFSLLFNIKFPEKHGLPKEIELITKVPEIQMELAVLKRQKSYEGLRSKTAGRKAFYDVLLEQYQSSFYEKRLKEAKAVAERIQKQYQMGTGSKEDAEYAKGLVEEYDKAFAISSVSFYRTKEKLGELVGTDVRFSYLFEEKLPDLKLSRSDLEQAVSFALQNEFSLYEAEQKRQYAERRLSEILGIYQGRYSQYIRDVSWYINTHQGKELNYEEFISLYNNALFAMDSPWYGDYVINMLFFKIRIPKEWFKGEYSGTRYLEDQKYALFIALVEKEQAQKKEESVKASLVSTLRDSFEVLKQMQNSLREAEENLTVREEAYQKALVSNQKGLTSFTSLEATKNNLYEQQRSLFEMRVNYAKALEDFNEASGGYIDFLRSGGSGNSQNGYESGDSFLEEGDGEANKEIPEWYIIQDTAGYRFTFGVRIPSEYGVDAYELFYNQNSVGGRQTIGKQLIHLGLTYEDTSLLELRFYQGGQLKYISYFDGGNYGGELTLVSAETAQSPFENLEEGTAVGQWSFLPGNYLTGEFTFAVNSYYKYDEFVIQYEDAEIGRNIQGESIQTLKLYFGKPEELKLILYQDGTVIKTFRLELTKDGEGSVVYAGDLNQETTKGNPIGQQNAVQKTFAKAEFFIKDVIRKNTASPLILLRENIEQDERKELRPDAAEFPDQTLLIGTHAIALQALTDELFEIASQSADETLQTDIYYKSDLTPGVWYNITSARDIRGITSGGTVVSNREINALTLEYYTKPSGITVRFGDPVNNRIYLSDFNSPSSPANLQECKELEEERKIQEELFSNTSKEVYKTRKSSLRKVLAEVKDPLLNVLTEQLHATENFLTYLVGQESTQEQRAALEHAKEELLKQRLKKSYELILDRLKKEIDLLDYAEHSELIQKYSAVMTSVEASLNELAAGEEMAEPVLSKLEKEAQTHMIEAALSENYEEAKKELQKVAAAEAILSGEIGIEETVVQSELLQEAVNQMEQELKQEILDGEGDEYLAAKADGENEAVLEALKQEQLSGLIQKFSELNSYFEALTLRENDPVEEVKLYNQKEKLFTNLMVEIKDSEFKEDFTKLVSAQVEQANEETSQRMLYYSSEYQTAVSEVEETKKALEQWNLKYLDAMDEGDIEASVRLQEEIKQAEQKLAAAKEYQEQLETDFAAGSYVPDQNISSSKEEELQRKALQKKLEKLENESGKGELSEAQKEEAENLLTEFLGAELYHLQGIADAAELAAELHGQSEFVKEGILEWREAELAIKPLEEWLTVQKLWEDRIASARDSKERLEFLTEEQKVIDSFLKEIEAAEIQSNETPLVQTAVKSAERILRAEQAKAEKLVNLEKEKQQAERNKLLGDMSGLTEEEKEELIQLTSDLAAEELQELTGQAAELKTEAKQWYQKLLEKEKGNDNGSQSAEPVVDIILPWQLIIKGLTKDPLILKKASIKIKDSILVPAEELILALGGNVSYSIQNSVIILRNQGSWIEFIPGEQETYINDKRKKLSIPPFQDLDGTVYLPLECFEVAYGFQTRQEGSFWISEK